MPDIPTNLQSPKRKMLLRVLQLFISIRMGKGYIFKGQSFENWAILYISVYKQHPKPAAKAIEYKGKLKAKIDPMWS